VENEIQDFVDLCTMGNISVFILAAKQHGFYIHGRSVHGFADTDMQTMIEQLSREEEDLCGRRGLLPQTDQQTFLISVPGVFRSVYSQVLQPLYASSATGSNLFTKKSPTGWDKVCDKRGRRGWRRKALRQHAEPEHSCLSFHESVSNRLSGACPERLGL